MVMLMLWSWMLVGYGYVSVVMISIMSDRSSSNVDDHSNAGHDYGNDNEINGNVFVLECNCTDLGSVNDSCDRTTGNCTCHNNVEGKSCSHCLKDAWGYHSGNGCDVCNCSEHGSIIKQCNMVGFKKDYIIEFVVYVGFMVFVLQWIW